ncbi:MAG: hypothetical protein ABIR06_02865 [Cyclobacteriaceae bacterium]
MQPRFLLPHFLKRIGWTFFIPALAFGIIVQHNEYEIPGFALAIGNGILVSGHPLKNNLTNELAVLMILISGFFVAFSKEKIEDEWVSKVRLESLQWSVYLNYALLVLTVLFVYDEGFFLVMIYNMFTMLIFFIVRFHYVLHIKDRLFNKTESA